ncbi:glutamate--cysteine ligase [Alcaligenes endophyticus]|uniref:Glutamate--cysteine ligase n=1 Tax=Alcaligenes endophyticus TaxID=1929088 RepID=A0ABT8EG48_9BURK|nr:glutamate--cysteine ligase [Alcaligenes endophyticus]MCX5590058.1 glutamate--cysteine ligase [Alcaligenes endophyticus]MDN4120279.1 glutamate--cysteine ligase [Alcaligenes endophyticus]
MTTRQHRLAALRAHPHILRSILRGIEKEGLRVNEQGQLAQTPHPSALGSALSNEHVTTDYAEALLELITSPHDTVAGLLTELQELHTFVGSKLQGEIVWNQSMPALLPDEKDIAIGWYGSSNTGMLKHVYRRGLAERYGKTMQCIAGVHYNFSLPDEMWGVLGQCGQDLQEQRSKGYLSLIRNFTRYSWLLMYLFGASPAISKNFLQGASSQLSQIAPDTLALPYATSLRMSDLGYQNKEAQAELQLCYNDLDTFIMRMYHAAVTPWPAYEAIGTHRDGEWIQLNTHILQIENEYYSSIRPKRTTGPCERPATALAERGVEYVEVRCMDIDPTAPLGISAQTCHFLDTFLLYCAVEDSPYFPDGGFCQDSKTNFASVVKEGRKPGLTLINQHKETVSLPAWGRSILDGMQAYAELLDESFGGTAHQEAVQAQYAKLENAEHTPSAQLYELLRSTQQSFQAFTLQSSLEHQQHLLASPLSAERLQQYERAASASIQAQQVLEATPSESFAEYVARYERNLTPPLALRS